MKELTKKVKKKDQGSDICRITWGLLKTTIRRNSAIMYTTGQQSKIKFKRMLVWLMN